MAFINYNLSDIKNRINSNDSYELNRHRVCNLININTTYILNNMRFCIVNKFDSSKMIDITPYIMNLHSGSGCCHDRGQDKIETLTYTFELDELKPNKDRKFMNFCEYLSQDCSSLIELYYHCGDGTVISPFPDEDTNHQLIINWLAGVEPYLNNFITVMIDGIIVSTISRQHLHDRHCRDIRIEFPIEVLNSNEYISKRNQLTIEPILEATDDDTVTKILTELGDRVTGVFPYPEE